MLFALMDGRALTAGELAAAGGITAPTASGHLAAMSAAGLINLSRQGRHRYFALASPAIAAMLETMMGVAATSRAASAGRQVITGPRDRALRQARTCYNHLAGSLAVAIADAMLERGQILLSAEGGALRPAGIEFLAALEVELGPASKRTRNDGSINCKPCLDWSERRMHIGGTIGTALYQTFVTRHWLRSTVGSRTVEITRAGEAGFRKHFGIDERDT
jgi:DNA-binding transcriptional ArsR family regulator